MIHDESWWYLMDLNVTIEYTWHILTSTVIFWQHLTSLYQHCYAHYCTFMHAFCWNRWGTSFHFRLFTWEAIDNASIGCALKLFKLVGIRFHGGLWKYLEIIFEEKIAFFSILSSKMISRDLHGTLYLLGMSFDSYDLECPWWDHVISCEFKPFQT